jgi:hypothetical protein
MYALLETTMLTFLRKTSLYLLAVPLLTLFLGIASNQVVLYVNNNRFPVQWNNYKAAHYDLDLHKLASEVDKKGKPTKEAEEAQFNIYALEEEGYIDDTHCLMTSDTRFNLLGDWIDFHTATYSPGDELIELGEWSGSFSLPVWFFAVIQKLRKSGDSEYGNTRSY